ncbi:MAG: AMP-binding protein [Dermatophilus congolensis]|nr:AMP-binding protein [Dermatophilus congolensis]
MLEQRRALAPLDHSDAAGGVIARFKTVVSSIPDETAVTDSARKATFTEIAAEAAGVRCHIDNRFGAVGASGALDDEGRPVPVAVLQGHTVRAVSTILGVIASGHPVVVLDSRTPAARLSELVQRTGARLVFADADLMEVAEQLDPACAPVSIDRVAVAESETGIQALWNNPADPSLPAALAFTSGSTGVPKIVINDQRMLTADAWGNSLATGCYDAEDVIAHTLPMAFHAGLMVTVAGLVVGCTMRLYDTRSHGIGSLAEWIDESGCTIMHSSPAILRGFVAVRPKPAHLVNLRSLTIAGEAAHGRDVEGMRRLIPETCVIRNRYGSSETGLIAEYAVTSAHPELVGPLPVGTPVGTTTVSFVTDPADDPLAGADDDLPPFAEGSGLVVINRDFLATGYWGNPAATQAAFGTDDEGDIVYTSRDIGTYDDEGHLRLLGRRDHSVKVRGYLVEPGDVDAALYKLPDVKEALTVGVPRPDSGQYRLVSYIASSAERPNAASVRAALRQVLPGHLVPESVVFLHALPRTERGKLDRAALPTAPEIEVGEPPANEWERLVAQLWAEILDVEEVGRDTDFFELGGDSLAAEELTSRVVSDLGVPDEDVNAAMLAESPTLVEYAKRLHRKPDPRNQTLSELRTTGSKPPLFFIAGGGGLGVGFVPVVRHLGEDQPVYALQSYGLERRALPDWSVKSTARRHVRSIQRIQPHGPYYIAGHSFGGIVALEIAKQLQAAGEKVDLLIELDSFPPDPALQPKPEPRSLTRKARDLVGLAVTGIVPTPGMGQYWRFHEQSRVLSAWYRTGAYAGRTLVVLADSPEKEERAQWGPHLSGKWDLVYSEGDHITMLRDPYARHVAEVITEALADARGETDATPLVESAAAAAPVDELEEVEAAEAIGDSDSSTPVAGAV